MDTVSDLYDLRDEIASVVEFLKASEVAQTSVGIAAYIEARILEKRLAKLNLEIAENEKYLDNLAEKFDNGAVL